MVALTLLVGCTQCYCLAPSGPAVDMAAATPEVAAAFAGPVAGTVVDAPGAERDGVQFEPCAIADQRFEVALDVASAGCHDCARGTFPLSGSLTVGDEPPAALSGSVEVWSTDDGLAVWQVSLDPPDAAFPYQTLEAAGPGAVPLSEFALGGLEWGRRQSDDDAAAVWEVCDLVADGG